MLIEGREDIGTSGGSYVIRFFADNLVLKIFATLFVYFSVKIFLKRLWSTCWCWGIPRNMYLLAAVRKYPYILLIFCCL
jgi:hypothetical protein